MAIEAGSETTFCRRCADAVRIADGRHVGNVPCQPDRLFTRLQAIEDVFGLVVLPHWMQAALQQNLGGDGI